MIKNDRRKRIAEQTKTLLFFNYYFYLMNIFDTSITDETILNSESFAKELYVKVMLESINIEELIRQIIDYFFNKTYDLYPTVMGPLFFNTEESTLGQKIHFLEKLSKVFIFFQKEFKKSFSINA